MIPCRLRLASVAVLAAIVGMTAAVDLHASGASAAPTLLPATLCRAVDTFSTDYKTYLTGVVTAIDSSDRVAFALPAVSAGQVTFVTDSLTCDRGARAHAAAAQQDTMNPMSIYLIRVGPTRFVGFNGQRAGEFLLYRVFDSSFVLLKTISG